MAVGAGNTQSRIVIGLAIGLVSVRALAVTGYHLAKADKSFRRAFDVIRSGKLERFSAIPQPKFPKASLIERLVYWALALAIAYALVLLKIDLICLEVALGLMIVGGAIDFILAVRLRVNTRKLMVFAVKLKQEVAKAQNNPPSPPKPTFGRALRT
jgi:hypothetical protein